MSSAPCSKDGGTATPGHRRARWRGWVRAVLLVALLLGVGGMHTLGHLHEDAHGHADHGMATVTASAVPSDAGPSLPTMDPTSTCLAIGTFAIALLGLTGAAFTRWPGPVSPPRTPGMVRRSMSCLAFPPEAPSLAKLQVLRI